MIKQNSADIVSSHPNREVLQEFVKNSGVDTSFNLTTSFANLTTSNRSFTPVSDDSDILYSFQFIARVYTISSDAVLPHFKLMVNGVEEDDSNLSINPGVSAYPSSETMLTYKHLVPSWGAGTEYVMRLQGREFSASYDTILYATYYWGSIAYASYAWPTLRITELAPA